MEELNAALMQKEGAAPCSEPGCHATTALGCEYVDRRARSCSTSWCPQHRAVTDAHVYCRRHAGVINALPLNDTSLTMPLPDLENRAPSLVAWVARQIDSDAWRLMLRELEVAGGGQLIADPVTLVFVGVERARAWERAWKLATHDGVKRRVSILVAEADDAEIEVKVGSNVVTTVMPPWIRHRVARETVSDQQDAEERQAFNEGVLEAMRIGLERERELVQRLESSRGVGTLHVAEAVGEELA